MSQFIINVYEQDVTENVLFVLYQSYKAPINKHQCTYLPGHNVNVLNKQLMVEQIMYNFSFQFLLLKEIL